MAVKKRITKNEIGVRDFGSNQIIYKLGKKELSTFGTFGEHKVVVGDSERLGMLVEDGTSIVGLIHTPWRAWGRVAAIPAPPAVARRFTTMSCSSALLESLVSSTSPEVPFRAAPRLRGC